VPSNPVDEAANGGAIAWPKIWVEVIIVDTVVEVELVIT
jgi:hypothetical protein